MIWSVGVPLVRRAYRTLSLIPRLAGSWTRTTWACRVGRVWSSELVVIGPSTIYRRSLRWTIRARWKATWWRLILSEIWMSSRWRHRFVRRWTTGICARTRRRLIRTIVILLRWIGASSGRLRRWTRRRRTTMCCGRLIWSTSKRRSRWIAARCRRGIHVITTVCIRWATLRWCARLTAVGASRWGIGICRVWRVDGSRLRIVLPTRIRRILIWRCPRPTLARARWRVLVVTARLARVILAGRPRRCACREGRVCTARERTSPRRRTR